MIKIVNGFKYDTDKSDVICTYDTSGIKATLYRNMFLKFYAVHFAMLKKNGKEVVNWSFHPLKINDVKSLLIDLDKIDEYEKLWGEIPEAIGEEYYAQQGNGDEVSLEEFINDSDGAVEFEITGADQTEDEHKSSHHKRKIEKKKHKPSRLSFNRYCKKSEKHHDKIKDFISNNVKLSRKNFRRICANNDIIIAQLFVDAGYHTDYDDMMYIISNSNKCIFEYALYDITDTEQLINLQSQAYRRGKTDIANIISSLLGEKTSNQEEDE